MELDVSPSFTSELAVERHGGRGWKRYSGGLYDQVRTRILHKVPLKKE